jgi:hypothetical protein
MLDFETELVVEFVARLDDVDKDDAEAVAAVGRALAEDVRTNLEIYVERHNKARAEAREAAAIAREEARREAGALTF